MKDIIDIALIDPNTDEAKKLYVFLKTTNDDVFEHHTPYPFQRNNEAQSIQLSYSLARNRASQKARPSFYVKNYYFKAYSGALFYRNLGKIILVDELETCIYVPGVKYLEKSTEKSFPQADEVEESKILALLNLGGKNFRKMDSHKVSFLLKDAGGVDLLDYWKNTLLSNEQRFRLCQAILRAYDEQIVQKNILHCDVKLDNMRVKEKKSGDYEVTFVDYEYALPLNGKAVASYKSLRGTPAYLSPQLVSQMAYLENFKYTREDDLWALQVAFLIIWEVPLLIHQPKFENLAGGNEKRKLTYYFAEFPGLIHDDYYGKLISQMNFDKQAAALLDRGLKFDPSQRFTFPELRQAWEAACPRPEVVISDVKHQHQLQQLDAHVHTIKKYRYSKQSQPLVNERLEKLERLKQKPVLTKMDMLKQRAWMEALSLLGTPKITLSSFKGVLIGAGILLGVVGLAAALLATLYFVGFPALVMTILMGIKVGLTVGGAALLGIVSVASVLSVMYHNHPPVKDVVKNEAVKSALVEPPTDTPKTLLRKLSLHSRERIRTPSVPLLNQEEIIVVNANHNALPSLGFPPPESSPRMRSHKSF